MVLHIQEARLEEVQLGYVEGEELRSLEEDQKVVPHILQAVLHERSHSQRMQGQRREELVGTARTGQCSGFRLVWRCYHGVVKVVRRIGM